MKRLLLAAIAGLLLCAPVASRADTYALVIGIADYPTPLDSDGNALKDAGGDLVDNDLRGSANDATAFHKLLTKSYGVPTNNVRVLTNKQATADAFLEGLKWLMLSAKPGDEVFLFFSGHGVQIPSENPEEADALDEAIVLYDTIVLDDTLKMIAGMFSDLNENFYVVLDSCFSGGMSRDVLKRVKSVRPKDIAGMLAKRVAPSLIQSAVKPQSMPTPTKRGSFTLISAGMENQPTIDATFTDGSPAHGVFTLVFTAVLTAAPSLSIESAIAETARLLKDAKFDQIPKVESTVASRLKSKLIGAKSG